MKKKGIISPQRERCRIEYPVKKGRRAAFSPGGGDRGATFISTKEERGGQISSAREPRETKPARKKKWRSNPLMEKSTRMEERLSGDEPLPKELLLVGTRSERDSILLKRGEFSTFRRP